jgi:flagellar FliL protein
MAEVIEAEEAPRKSPILKIVLLVVIALLMMGGSVGATLFFTGFFKPAEQPPAEAQLDATAAGAAQEAQKRADKKGTDLPPKMVPKASPELTRFEHTYLELERPLLANLTNSRKVMQVQVALMTRYDDRVFKNVKKHEFALRSVALDVMRKITDADIAQPEFRKNLADSIRQEMNAVLQKFEDFGGIEELYFTTFVVQ